MEPRHCRWRWVTIKSMRNGKTQLDKTVEFSYVHCALKAISITGDISTAKISDAEYVVCR